MIVTLIPYCPKSEGQNLGFAYNELMGRLREDDWACFIDHDACFTTRDWYVQLEEITARLTEPCVLTATTNRVGSRGNSPRGSITESLDGLPSAIREERAIGSTRCASGRH